MFKWLGFELCLEFFILNYTPYYTTQYILYCTVLQSQREEWAKNALFQHWNVCSCWEACLTWNDGLSLKHIQCFLLMSHDCLPTLWLDSYFNLDIQAEGSELQASTSLFYSLMPSFSSMPIFEVAKILLDLLEVTKTVWSAPSGISSVRQLEEPLYWVFLSALCLTSVGSLYVLYDI